MLIVGTECNFVLPVNHAKGFARERGRDAMKSYKDEAAFVTELENVLSVGVKWKFIKNYAYKKGIKNTIGKAMNVHQDHFHLGYR